MRGTGMIASSSTLCKAMIYHLVLSIKHVIFALTKSICLMLSYHCNFRQFILSFYVVLINVCYHIINKPASEPFNHSFVGY